MTIQLFCGDCLEILPTLPAQSVDAILTDLPYGTTACSWDTVIPFADLWRVVRHVLKPRGVFVTTASQPFTSALVMSNTGWFRHEWTWDKARVTGGANAKKAPMKAHENVLVFSQLAPVYNPQMTQWTDDQIKRKRKRDFPLKPNARFIYGNCLAPGREKQVKNGRHPDTVIRIHALGSLDPERTDHPTQKPVALYEYLTLTYTNAGDTVLDLCAGSGTTGVACVKTGRNFIGVEKRQDYFEIMERRIREAQAQGVMAL